MCVHVGCAPFEPTNVHWINNNVFHQICIQTGGVFYLFVFYSVTHASDELCDELCIGLVTFGDSMFLHWISNTFREPHSLSLSLGNWVNLSGWIFSINLFTMAALSKYYSEIMKSNNVTCAYVLHPDTSCKFFLAKTFATTVFRVSQFFVPLYLVSVAFEIHESNYPSSFFDVFNLVNSCSCRCSPTIKPSQRKSCMRRLKCL